MPITYFLQENHRLKFQRTWGKPIFGKEEEVFSRYQKIIDKNKYDTIVTVGDYCSAKLFSDIKIFDKKVQRNDFLQKTRVFCL